MKDIYEKLREYSCSDYYGFHMPGHKRNRKVTGADLPYEIDITEIEGFDNLHHPKGILKDLQLRAASLFHSEETYCLVNGSTVGILCGILASTRRGGRILVARNCHKSVYNGIFLQELRPVYVYPQFDRRTGLNGEIRAEDIEGLLNQYKDIQAVVITSPTYDGVMSDVRAIAEVVHAKGIPLIVDEAHGAHFGFHSYFPKNANEKGADIVVHSIHKTLPAFTQTALLHVNGPYADRERVRKYLQMLQTSSPSYVLMAGIGECIRVLEENREEIFGRYVSMLKETRERIDRLSRVRLLRSPKYDPSKIVISVDKAFVKDEGGAAERPMTGWELYHILLERYHLQMEMAAGHYVIAMTGPGDTAEGMTRLVDALTELNEELEARQNEELKSHAEMSVERGSDDRDSDHRENEELKFSEEMPTESRNDGAASDCRENEELNFSAEMSAESGGKMWSALPRAEQEYTPSQAEGRLGEMIEWCKAEGRISLEYAYLYPPGIPIIVPGERISAEAAALIDKYERQGFAIEGIQEKGRIKVMKNG